jgi:hypothetical protein
MNLVTPEFVGADAVKSTAASSVKRLYDPEIALAGGVGVVAAHESRRADVAVTWSQAVPPVTDPTPLRITRLPVGRRASGFVLVAK